VFRRVGIDGFVEAAMDLEVGLPVARQVDLRQPQRTGRVHRRLPDPAPYRLTIDPAEDARRRDVDGDKLDQIPALLRPVLYLAAAP